ncbi:MAG: AsmA family protein [Desulfobacterales bacterium]|nr:MAG: AsmA family protein [Desulfobacterales bacterium]
MPKILKWALIVAGSLVVVIIAALLVIPRFVDVQKYKPVLESKVTEATGRPFTVGDDLHLSLFPWAGLSFSDLHLGNPEGFAEKDFVAVKSFEVRVKLLPLLSKDIQVKRLIINEPQIVLIKNKDGRVNWTQPPGKPGDKSASESTQPPAGKESGLGLPIKALAVGDFSIKKGSALWIDHAAGTRRQISNLNLNLRDVSLDRPIQLAFSALVDERPVSLEGTVGHVGQPIGQGIVPLDFSISALDELKLRVKGNIANPVTNPAIDVALDLAEFSPRKLSAALGQPFPIATADAQTLNRIALTAGVKADPTHVAVTDGKLDLDQSKLTFAFKAADFAKPDVTFDLNLDQIDLDRYLPSKAQTKLVPEKKSDRAQPDKNKQPASTTPAPQTFDYGPLAGLAVDGQVKVGKIIFNAINVQNVQFKIQGKNSPITVALSARLDEQPVSLEGTVGPFGKQPGQETVPLDLALNALNELKLRLKGRVENPSTKPRIDMALDVTEFSPRKLFAALGQPFPITTADPKALNRIALAARIKADPATVSVSGGRLDLDESKLNFTVNAADLSKPAVAWDLNLDQINLDRYLPPAAEGKGAEGQPQKDEKPAAPGVDRPKTDYAPLRRMRMDGQLKAGKLIVNKAQIADVHLKIAGKDGVFTLDPLKLNVYEGAVSARGLFNVKEDIPSSNINLEIQHLQVGPLLREQMGKDILEGVTTARVKVTLAGDAPEQIKKTLNGEGELKFNDGAIKGIDLAGMVRNVKATFGLAPQGQERPRTDFSELLVPFTITNGVVNTPQTSMKSPLIRVSAMGDADLVDENLDLRVEPKVVATIKGQGDEKQRTGFMVPVLVTGSFADPKFRPDLKGIAMEKIEKEVLQSEKVKKVLESDQAKKVLEKEELKPLQEPAKDLLKGLLKKN